MRTRALFRVTNNVGYQVWGVLVGWNPERKFPIQPPEGLKSAMQPNTRWSVEADLGADDPKDLLPSGWELLPEPDPNDGLGPTARERGLQEIDDADWTRDEYGCLNLYVHDTQGVKVHSWLQLRPEYCDRGHIQLMVELNGIDSADKFPRYFFTAEEAKNHTKTFLMWRIWKHRTFRHEL